MAEDSTNPKLIESMQLMSTARDLLAYVEFDEVVRRPMFDSDENTFPHFVTAANGYELTDSMGRKYVDWVNGRGSILLGHYHPEVSAAIGAQMSAGPATTLMHPVEIDVAKRLVEMVPCAEQVGFFKDATAAADAALRISRAATGRDVILQHGFHGFGQWYQVLHPDVQGIPGFQRSLVDTISYNDLESLEQKLNFYADRVAAVIMEPVNFGFPIGGYLENVRRVTQENGCLLIFDEVTTGFRLANGGAQQHFGVTPDLAILGNSFSNGMSVSAIVGRRDFMQRLPSCGFGAAYRADNLSLAAAQSVLQILDRDPVCQRLNEIGATVRERLSNAARKHGVPCQLCGPDVRMTIEFRHCGDLPAPQVRSLFLQECLKHGVLTDGTLMPSYAIDDEAIDRTFAAFDIALKKIAEAIDASRVRASEEDQRMPVGPRAFVAEGYLEALYEENESLHINGWMLLDDGAADSIVIESFDGTVVQAEPVERPDLQSGFPGQPTAIHAGYDAVFPIKSCLHDGSHEFSIVAKRRDTEAFRCRVIKNEPGAEIAFAGPHCTDAGVLYL